MPLPRILIIANKSFEAEPLMGVLADPAARPASLSNLGTLVWPRMPQSSLPEIVMQPRATFLYGSDRQCQIEIWCIQDLMNPFLSYSNTAEKARVLKELFEYGKTPDFVVALGTAAFPNGEDSYNGCVMLGSKVFVHNPYSENPASNWRDPRRMDQVISSAMGERFVAQVESDSDFRETVSKRMLPVPRTPAGTLELRPDPRFTAVTEVNIVDRNDYGRFDEDSVNLARRNGADPAASVETTHGVIRFTAETPFVFLSGITNRLGRFNDEVANGSAYAQNFAAAHNAAVVAIWMIQELATFLATGPGSSD